MLLALCKSCLLFLNSVGRRAWSLAHLASENEKANVHVLAQRANILVPDDGTALISSLGTAGLSCYKY